MSENNNNHQRKGHSNGGNRRGGGEGSGRRDDRGGERPYSNGGGGGGGGGNRRDRDRLSGSGYRNNGGGNNNGPHDDRGGNLNSYHSHSPAGVGSTAPSTSHSTASQTPTTTSPTTAFPREQLLSTPGGMVMIKYHDEQSGMWGMRRPAGTGQGTHKGFSISVIALGSSDRSGTDTERAAALSDTLNQSTPTFVALMEVSDSMFAAIQAQPGVRRHYAVTDQARVAPAPLPAATVGETEEFTQQVGHGCIFLVRHTVNVDFAEFQPRLVFQQGANRTTTNRPFVLLHMRNFAGNSCTLGIIHLDPNNTLAERCASIGAAVAKMDQDDIVALAGNFGDHVSDVKDHELRKELGDTMRQQNMADSYEVATDSVNSAPVSLWVKVGSKAAAQSVSPLPGERRWCRFGSLIQLQFRSPLGSSNSSSSPLMGAGIAIPQPRSAKGFGKNSPATAIAGDPAVVALDEHLTPTPASLAAAAAATTPHEGINVATLITSAMKPKQPRFRKDNVFHMRGGNRTLSQDESHYDLTSYFSSVAEAVEQINGGLFPWLADFFVVNQSILGAEHVSQCDIKAFRRYVQSKPNPWLLLERLRNDSHHRSNDAHRGEDNHAPATTTAAPSGGGVNITQLLAEKAARKEPLRDESVRHTAAHHASSHHPAAAANTNTFHAVPGGPVVRPRLWSESCCSLLYQVTPKEMKFDISAVVGAMRGNLKLAITRLNTKKTMAAALSEKPDPLLDYGYDYALLYCPERAAYWLLAASDVPCDIVACRHAASS